MSKHEVSSWRQCRPVPVVRGRRKGIREVRVSEGWATAGPNAKSWLVCREVKWTGLRNPPGELAILLDPYMARRKSKHNTLGNHLTGHTPICRGAQTGVKASIACPRSRFSPCSVTLCLSPRLLVSCLCSPVSPEPAACVRGRVPRSVCFVSSMQPHLAVGLSVCRPSV